MRTSSGSKKEGDKRKIELKLEKKFEVQLADDDGSIRKAISVAIIMIGVSFSLAILWILLSL